MKFVCSSSIVAILLSFSSFLFAQTAELGPDALPVLSQESQHATAAERISKLYTRSHYRKVPFDDELSSQVFDTYLKRLDYSRNLLLEEDVKRFEVLRHQLDQDIPAGKLDAMYSMFNLCLERRYQQQVYALSLLDKPMNFDLDEEYQPDRSDAQWPKTTAEIKELWRLKVKYDALNLKLAGRDWDKTKEVLSKRYNRNIKRLTQTTSEDVFGVIMGSYSRAIEPHTSYLTPAAADQFDTDINLSLEGIGAVLRTTEEYTVVESLIPGGPAALSQAISPGDKIVSVGQKEGELVDIVDWRIDHVVKKIKGPKGTPVYLELLKSDGASTVITLMRDKIKLEERAAKGEIIDVNGEKVGILEVSSFYNGLTEDAQEELEKLNQQGISSLVVDLRRNGGGSLVEASSFTGLFIEQGPVVQVRNQLGRIAVEGDGSGKVTYQGPMLVLVDRYSASASEIFAAALQDYGRALIVGEQTFGKGTVQQDRRLGRMFDMFENPLGRVQYTIAKFYRIDGGSTQHKGVIPDIKYPSAMLPEETGESLEENALPWDKIRPASYKMVGKIKPYLKPLDVQHQLRIEQDPEFQYVLSDIVEYRATKDQTAISLNKEKRLTERESQEKKSLARTNERLKRMNLEAIESNDDLPDDIEFEDAFLNEAAKIALDLSELVKKS